MRLKRQNILSTLLLVLFISPLSLSAQDMESIGKLKEMTDEGMNFIIGTDLGRNGFYDQKYIANTMGIVADECGAEFIVASGDTFHYMGVQSTSDPLFLSNFENVYSHPETQIPWYPILGNHEYRGNTQAVLDYSDISRRWQMPARYYTKSFKLDNGEVFDLFFIDTPPLIDKYRNDSTDYPDAVKQDRELQIKWLESELSRSKAQHKMVIGHHPIYADTSKADIERLDMQKYVDALLRKYKVDIYSCGHIHTFQHIRMPKSPVDYMVVASGSLSRKVKPTDGTVFCAGQTGFAFVSVKDGAINVYFLDKDGKILHSFRK